MQIAALLHFAERACGTFVGHGFERDLAIILSSGTAVRAALLRRLDQPGHELLQDALMWALGQHFDAHSHPEIVAAVAALMKAATGRSLLMGMVIMRHDLSTWEENPHLEEDRPQIEDLGASRFAIRKTALFMALVVAEKLRDPEVVAAALRFRDGKETDDTAEEIDETVSMERVVFDGLGCHAPGMDVGCLRLCTAGDG